MPRAILCMIMCCFATCSLNPDSDISDSIRFLRLLLLALLHAAKLLVRTITCTRELQHYIKNLFRGSVCRLAKVCCKLATFLIDSCHAFFQQLHLRHCVLSKLFDHLQCPRRLASITFFSQRVSLRLNTSFTSRDKSEFSNKLRLLDARCFSNATELGREVKELALTL